MIRPLQDRILVKRIEAEEKTSGGIIIPDTAKEKPQEGEVVAVGRAHLIPADSDGSAADHAGPNATRCPSFGPLSESSNRPAIQIRQMGTRLKARRQGHAATVLHALENASKEHFGAKIGLLQAREIAIPFYLSQGWTVIDEPY